MTSLVAKLVKCSPQVGLCVFQKNSISRPADFNDKKLIVNYQ